MTVDTGGVCGTRFTPALEDTTCMISSVIGMPMNEYGV